MFTAFLIRALSLCSSFDLFVGVYVFPSAFDPNLLRSLSCFSSLISSSIFPMDPVTTNLSKLPTFITLYIRLDRNNYTFWRSQVLATAKAHGYEDILMCGADSIPKSNQSDEESIKWHRRDQFLLSWMFSSISESMLGYVSRCTHAFEVWSIFENLFRYQSKARAMNLKFQLLTLKKGQLSIDEYMLQMQVLADGLKAAGHDMSDDDLVLYILGRLGAEFNAVVVNLTTQGEMPSLPQVQSILHTHEMRLQQFSTVTQFGIGTGSNQTPQNPVANVASKDMKSNGGGKFKGKTKFGTKPKVVCQLCGKDNHAAAKCYKRFDTNFLGLDQQGHSATQTT